MAATYDENYILVACSEDNLLSKIHINSGDSENLINYNEIPNMEAEDILAQPDQVCSISIDEDIAYISISIAFTNETSTFNNFFLIKINLQNGVNGPEIISKSFFKFPYAYKKSPLLRQLSCETIQVKDSNDKRVVCTFERYVDLTGKSTNIVAQAIKNDFTAFEGSEIKITKYSYESSFQCYKTDLSVIACTMRKYLYNISLIYDSSNKLKLQYVKHLDILDASNNLYYFSKYFIISAKTENVFKINTGTYYIQININANAYYRIYDYSATSENGVVKMISFFIENDNILYIIYHSDDKIKYISMSGIIRDIFNFEPYNKIYKIISNTNENELLLDEEFITTANSHGVIEIQNTIEYQENSKSTYRYLINKNQFNLFPYNKTNNILYAPQTNNYWYYYNFAYIDDDDNYLRILYFNNINITIETCAYQCESCTIDYYSCNNCRNDLFSKLTGSTGDNNCYPVNQTFEGYIYNSLSKNFEKCYFSCKFCSEAVSDAASSDHKCKVCAEGFYPSYQYPGNCYRMDETQISSEKYVEQETDESFTLKSCSETGKIYKIDSTGECVDQCPTTSYYYTYEYTYINFTEQTNEAITKNQYILNILTTFPKYSFNKICYENCPTNTEIDTSNNECKCKYAWHKDISTNEIVCYGVNYCISSDYKYYYDDTKECKQNGDTTNYYQFNFQLYKEGCPENTNEDPENSHKCESIYSYCYINENFQYICSNTQSEEYIYRYDNTKQYLKLCSDSLTYTTLGSKTYLYDGVCYLNCPSDITNADEDNDKCICKYYGYYSDNDNYICYGENEKCNDKIPVVDLFKCLDSIDDCINNEYKIFNNECYSQNCPVLTKTNENNECICEFSYYNDNNIISCFNQAECENIYPYSNPNTLECFISLEDCFSKNNLLFYDMNCYKDSCPSGKIPLNSITNEEIKNTLISELSLETDLISKQCVCDIINTEINWNKESTDGKILQICTENCEEEYEPDQLTRKCVEKCNPSRHYVFNDICYKEGCPEGTQLNSSNPDSRICVCEKSSYIENNITICCDELAGTCPFLNLSNCPTDFKIYKYDCYSNCPEKTCLTQSDSNLVTCINITSSMNVIGGICFENIDDIINNLKNNEREISPISNLKDTAISGYYINDEVYKYSADSNYSLLFLNDCEDKLRHEYSLDFDAKLFVIQIESSNKEKKSAINKYNYAIFLEDGTQLNISKCEGKKITLSSPIIDTESVHFDKALYFAGMNYDIYNESSEFYTDSCAPASISGNDITLTDRKIDFYPSNISLCNDSCNYNFVNLTTKRFVCDCEAFTEFVEESDVVNNDENKEDDSNYYIDYFLSLINYKIAKCFILITDINNFKNNIGSYLGAATIVSCVVLMFVFIVKGMMVINEFIFNGIPTKSKLLNKKKQSEQRKSKSETNANLNDGEEKVSQPPKKKDNIVTDEKYLEDEEENDFNAILKLFGKSPRSSRGLNINEEKIISEKNTLKTKNSKNAKESKNTKGSKKAKKSIKSTNSKKLKGNELDSEPKSAFYPKKLKSKNKALKKSLFKIINIEKENKIEAMEELSSKDDDYIKKKSSFNKNSILIGFRNITEQEKKILQINYKRLMIIRDDKERHELNIVPYSQALRLDNRNFFQIFFSVIANKIEILKIFYYRNEVMHLSLSISIYLFSLLLDLTLNCFLYSDDVVSEKYHNDGKLEFITSFVLSLFSNIFSAIIVFVIEKLTQFSEILELIVRDIFNISQYYFYISKFKKVIKLKLTLFFIIQFISNIFMLYYLSIFCIVYSRSQTSILLNYLYGVVESLAISLGIALAITIIRFFGMKYKWEAIYNTSKYFYETF